MKWYILLPIAAVLFPGGFTGCVSEQAHKTVLSKAEKSVLQNYADTYETVERAAEICLRHELAKEEVLRFTDNGTYRTVVGDNINFFYAPSQIFTLTFDGNGRAVEANLGWKRITREQAQKAAKPETQPAR